MITIGRSNCFLLGLGESIEPEFRYNRCIVLIKLRSEEDFERVNRLA